VPANAGEDKLVADQLNVVESDRASRALEAGLQWRKNFREEHGPMPDQVMDLWESGEQVNAFWKWLNQFDLGPGPSHELVHVPLRIGPAYQTGSGVVEGRHNANLRLLKANSNETVEVWREHSGETPNWQENVNALGQWGASLLAHTEAKGMIRLADLYRGGVLQQGQTVHITGQQQPCTSCRARMNEAAKQYGIMIIYQWREGGKTRTWIPGFR
jgi:hypothetical protein